MANHRPFVLAVAIASGATALAAGCSRGGTTGSATGSSVIIDEASRKEAADIFAGRCTVCHGPEGAGDGPASAGLNPHPRNFKDATWQTSVTDDHIEKIVMYGGTAVGKSAAMPPNPDLMAKPLVVAGLREKVRSLGR